MEMKENRPHSIRPRKSWGQHFLIDYNIQRKILNVADLQPEERVVEVGPGRGILTKGLLDRGAHVIAIEIDPQMVDFIRKEITDPRLDLVLGDALQYPYENIPGRYKVVANLPYYISTPLLFRFLQERQQVDQMILMLQKEVAERLAAGVGKKSYGALSVIFQFYADIQIAFTVSPTCFRPRPQVGSAVIDFKFLPAPRVAVCNEAAFIKVVKGAFSHRRKSLTNSLTDAGFPREQIESALSNMGLDRTRRGETLNLAEFAVLSDLLFDSGGLL
jgi:16S rRNA (adenine1518-N6/adenine1519-N6)-dimethyltransferase